MKVGRHFDFLSYGQARDLRAPWPPPWSKCGLVGPYALFAFGCSSGIAEDPVASDSARFEANSQINHNMTRSQV
ncbi:hypothetical protein CFIMG_004115RAa [Ceratocystis fimbriata CBS 114723]|uniref:Uncharacterized protein n=1 Tax=Ceratocystis fimbriata CBS 114723 TaxID=1035309 RepID=A0A2C5WJ63_9PEZI|nr:hypothetical protein CFIMG_004115RAa [Ceratocystis fimbriata CBS 114723]